MKFLEQSPGEIYCILKRHIAREINAAALLGQHIYRGLPCGKYTRTGKKSSTSAQARISKEQGVTVEKSTSSRKAARLGRVLEEVPHSHRGGGLLQENFEKIAAIQTGA